ncbi:hypothetical protein O9992_24355 [Vibrio lentus]|nr:hypothetical protein [Vibrio lentus]
MVWPSKLDANAFDMVTSISRRGDTLTQLKAFAAFEVSHTSTPSRPGNYPGT